MKMITGWLLMFLALTADAKTDFSIGADPQFVLADIVYFLAHPEEGDASRRDEAYARAVLAHFGRFRDHEAVAEYRRRRLSGSEALSRFKRESGFQEFFEKNKAFYARYADALREQLSASKRDPHGAFEQFTGTRFEARYRLIVSPYLNGEHGANYVDAQGGVPVITTVLKASSLEKGRPRFNDAELDGVLWHEAAHALFDPLLHKHWESASRIQECAEPKSNEYTLNWQRCIQEQIAEGLSLKLAGKTLGHFPALTAVFEKIEKQRGAKELADFYPELLNAFLVPAQPGLNKVRRPPRLLEAFPDLVEELRRYDGEGRHQDSRDLLGRLLKIFPKDPLLWIESARTGLSSGDSAGARRFLKKAQGLNPNAAQLHTIALMLQRAGDHARSLKILNSLVKKNPENAVYLKDKGICEYFAGNPAAAEASLRRALSLDGALWSAYSSLGALYIAQGRIQDARPLYEKALLIKPSIAEEKSLRDFMERSLKEISGRR